MELKGSVDKHMFGVVFICFIFLRFSAHSRSVTLTCSLTPLPPGSRG